MTSTFPMLRLFACGLVLVACGDDAENGGESDAPDAADAAETASETAGDDTTSPPDDTVENPDTTAPDTVGPAGATTELVLDESAIMVLGLSRFFEVTIPDDVVSVTITVLGDEATYYGLADWTGPDGFELVASGWTQTQEASSGLCTSCKNRIALSTGAFAAVAPNNPAAELIGGTHSFSLFGYKPAQVVNSQGTCGDGTCNAIDQFQCPRDCPASPAVGDVRVLVHVKRSGGGLPATGVLDLNLHFTGAQGLTAANAPTDPGFQETLQSMRDIYAQVGITLGEIRYLDVDEQYKKLETLDGAGSDLQAMFAESEGGPDALNLYFVDSISAGAFGGFGVVLGIAGGIPGPVAQGSWRSGVAIAIKPVAGVPAGVDTTMAHETGHFLGLFHTSEQAFFGPQLHDPLPDTPENDESYLMFNTGAGNVLSEWQGRVMRSSPWVRHPAN